MKSNKKKFLQLPEYPGGKEAFKEYIRKNLKYPPEALKNSVEGIVQLVAEIDDNGDVQEVVVENGPGFGCSEEAVRLIKNVRFGGVKNKGLRVKTRKKFKIVFKLPSRKEINATNEVNYIVVKNKIQDNKQTAEKKYAYTIQIKSNENL